MRIRLRRVGTGSVFLLALVIYGTAGLLVGALVAAASTVPVPEGYRLTILDRLGLWSLAVFPVVYGLAGGVFAALAAVLYNLAAAVTGGVTADVSGLEPAAGERPAESGGAGEEEPREEPGEPQEAADAPAGRAPSSEGEPSRSPSSRSSGR